VVQIHPLPKADNDKTKTVSCQVHLARKGTERQAGEGKKIGRATNISGSVKTNV
jgi:hypothetical protein